MYYEMHITYYILHLHISNAYYMFSRRCAFINFSSFKPDTKNDANFDTLSRKRANLHENWSMQTLF